MGRIHKEKMKHKLPKSYKNMNIEEREIYWVAYWKGYDHALDRIQGTVNEQKERVRKEK